MSTPIAFDLSVLRRSGGPCWQSLAVDRYRVGVGEREPTIRYLEPISGVGAPTLHRVRSVGGQRKGHGGGVDDGAPEGGHRLVGVGHTNRTVRQVGDCLGDRERSVPRTPTSRLLTVTTPGGASTR